MNNTTKSKIRILQHNCAKSTNAMQSCLEYGKQNVDIILMQEPWIDPNLTRISHSAYYCIMPNMNKNDVHKPRVLSFVSKKLEFSITPRPDISSDSDIQVLNISGTNIDNFTILNVYNEKCLKENSNEYTIERELINIELTQNSIICGDFNAHHSWWNSKINNSIRSNALIAWLQKFKCELINTPDEFTFRRGNSKSIIDLTFITPNLINSIECWSINEEAYTESYHEFIDFFN